MNIPVFDLHCDTAYELLKNRASGRGMLLQNALHIDLRRTKSFPAYAQCFACYTSPLTPRPQGMDVKQLFWQEYETILWQIEENKDHIKLALSAQQVINNAGNGLASAILTIEGTAGFSYDPQALEDLHHKGFRMTTLGWNESNPLCGSHATGEGLTERGREYVRQAQRLGMMVDVSHLSDKGFWDIMDMTQAPVVASHSNSRSICGHSRNLTDEMFLEICKTDGVVGINLYSHFLGDRPTLDTVCDHILHWLELDPEGKHISLGADLDGCDELPEGYEGIQDYPKLSAAMGARGIDRTLIENIFWNNAIGVMERCCT